jgi:hypothetical protein
MQVLLCSFDIAQPKEPLQSATTASMEVHRASCCIPKLSNYRRPKRLDYASNGMFHHFQVSLALLRLSIGAVNVVMDRGRGTESLTANCVAINSVAVVVTRQCVARTCNFTSGLVH